MSIRPLVGSVDLSQATADPDQANCARTDFSVVGNFYQFTGTGQAVRITMESTLPSDSVKTLFVVLFGTSCSSLECLDFCWYDCEVSTILGGDYYVFAYYMEEFSAPTGVVTLQVLDV